MSRLVTLIAVAASLLFVWSNHVGANEPFSLRDGEVVVFLGGTNMVRAQRAGELETRLTDAFASSKPRFRDFSWEGDTVFSQGTVTERWRKVGWKDGGFGSLAEQLDLVGATVVMIQFGTQESMAGRAHVDRFETAYEQLLDEISADSSRRVVLITPIPFEQPSRDSLPDLRERNSELSVYVDAIRRLGQQRSLAAVDLFHGHSGRWTENGIHVHEQSQSELAHAIAQKLGIPSSGGQLDDLREAVREKHRLWYDYWRPANWKLLFGDDAQRQFTRGGPDQLSLRDEWKRLLPLIDDAEKRVWTVAGGGQDPGPNRPQPESLHGDPTANVKVELDAFEVADGFEVNLFASEEHGLTSPLNLRWDPSGRMYVTVTTTYPHVYPGDVPNDKVIVLEDSDHDGVADKSSVFADGLNIPTGIEIGDGGVYIGQNTEILFLRDSDGDGRADQRSVVLGGFGNGDSHQTINSFIWSPDGQMILGQGDGIESRVETPWGISKLFMSGFYRWQPRRMKLIPFLDTHKGPGNPWGVAFDRWGQCISVDGAGGVTLLPPAMAPTAGGPRYRPVGRIGEPGGYCGIGYLDGPGLPESMRDDFVIGDYKANRIKRFALARDGAGYSLHWKDPLLQSRHRNFRPVDVKLGPDGAIYVVDWYNPITCHQDDAYRDPTRDKAHGRIWRIAAKQSVATTPINLSESSLSAVVAALGSPDSWTRYQAKREMTARPAEEVSKEIRRWVRSLDPKDPDYEHRLVEGLGASATIESVDQPLLRRVLTAGDPRARALATRIVGRWHDRIQDPLSLLADRIGDEDPLVRMEAVVACSLIDSPASVTVATRVVDQPMDRFIQYALTQTVRHLRSTWVPALERGELEFDRPNHLAEALHGIGSESILPTLKTLLEEEQLDRSARLSVIQSIVAVGQADDVVRFALQSNSFRRAGPYDTHQHAEVLRRLSEMVELGGPSSHESFAAPLGDLLASDSHTVRRWALTLIGLWKIDALKEQVQQTMHRAEEPSVVRAAAMDAWGRIAESDGAEPLKQFASHEHTDEIRLAAIAALGPIDSVSAAQFAANWIAESKPQQEWMEPLLKSFLGRDGGPPHLAAALESVNFRESQAHSVMTSLFSLGRSDQVLLDVLQPSVGGSNLVPAYHPTLVDSLVEQAKNRGDATRGVKWFAAAACASCHRISGRGGNAGPDLTAIGTTLSPERIVEEVLWPNRQVKEGYSYLMVLTNDGHIHVGKQLPRPGTDGDAELVLEDAVTEKQIVIDRETIEEMIVKGSPMPSGLTTVLSEPQLLDLIQYLSQLGKFQ